MSENTEESRKQELVITRIFNAPRDLVWKAWTEPERLKQWWGPKGYTSTVWKADIRVGGKSFSNMRSPDGKDFWSTGVYREIVPLERIVITDSFADEQGNVVPASNYGVSADFPLELLITVTFEEQEGMTKLTLRHSGIRGLSDMDRRNMEQGWNESFDKLEEYLQKAEMPTIV